MGIFSIANQHIRFAVKLATAIVLALFVGFHFQLETPRWAVLTAAIVAAGPALLREVNRILALFAIVAFAHHRHIYWLYCRTGDHHCDDPRTIIDDSGVLYLGRFLYLDILAGTNRKLVRVGAGRLYRADHCDHHSAGTIAYAAVCRRTL